MYRKMRLFVIKDREMLKHKLEMLQSLGDIEIASRLIEELSKDKDQDKDKGNELNANYTKLHCNILALEKEVSS